MQSSCDSDDPSADLNVCPNPAGPNAIVLLYQIRRQCSQSDINISIDLNKKVPTKKQVIFLSKASNIVLGFDLSNTYINIDDVFIFLDQGFWEKVGQLYRKK